jgi:hypothetical protein
VDVQATFVKGDKGQVMRLTLNLGGEQKAKKIK